MRRLRCMFCWLACRCRDMERRMSTAIRRLYRQARRERCAVTSYTDEQGVSWAVFSEEAWATASWGEDCRHGERYMDIMGGTYIT